MGLKWEEMERLQWAGLYHLALKYSSVLLLESRSVDRRKNAKNSTRLSDSYGNMILREWTGWISPFLLPGKLTNSPVCSSIIHSILLFPSKLPPCPFLSPSKFSFPFPFSFVVYSPLSVLRVSKHKLRNIKDEWAGDHPTGSGLSFGVKSVLHSVFTFLCWLYLMWGV